MTVNKRDVVRIVKARASDEAEKEHSAGHRG